MTGPRHTLVQISDPHLDAAAALYGAIDTVAALREALAVVAAMERRPAAVLLTGDLANEATPDDYRCVRGLVEPTVRELGAELVVLPGNHDVTGTLREHLLGDTRSTGPMDSSLRLGGLRVVALDSTVENGHHGELSADQLARLGAELQEPAPDGTVLAIHHPPLPSPVGLMEHVALREPERLFEAIRDTDVRLVVSGHAHHTACGEAGGVPVWISPSTAYTADVTAPDGLYRGIAGGAGLTRIDVFADTVVASFVPLAGRDPIVELDVDTVLAEL